MSAPCRFLALLPVLGQFLCIGPAALAKSEPRYIAVFCDGSYIEGDRITGWNEELGRPQLDSTDLLSPTKPLRWLRDRSLSAFAPSKSSDGFIEFFGGDRLPGQIVGFHESSTNNPSHLLVKNRWSLNLMKIDDARVKVVRVVPRSIRRVVFGSIARDRLRPGTVWDLQGRATSFRRLRWQSGAVELLLDSGIRRVGFSQIAEIHLPQQDAWQMYLEELAVLAQDETSRLVRLETKDGLIATSSTTRQLAAASRSGIIYRRNRREYKDKQYHWYHATQPVWSLDPLWVNFLSTRTRSYFAPHEVPLSRLTPSRIVHRPILAHGWTPQVGTSVRGGPLAVGGRHGAWGFGVHAPSELWFVVPPIARSFQGWVGLDDRAGEGGCARVQLFWNSLKSSPLYSSPFLVGSGKIVDTGMVRLPDRQDGTGTLILIADPAHKGRPAGADPLDIRDMVNILDPILVLDRRELADQIRRQSELRNNKHVTPLSLSRSNDND